MYSYMCIHTHTHTHTRIYATPKPSPVSSPPIPPKAFLQPSVEASTITNVMAPSSCNSTAI